MNFKTSKDIIESIYFTGEEINKLLEGKGSEEFSTEFRIMTDKTGRFDWPEGLPKNIRAS